MFDETHESWKGTHNSCSALSDHALKSSYISDCTFFILLYAAFFLHLSQNKHNVVLSTIYQF